MTLKKIKEHLETASLLGPNGWEPMKPPVHKEANPGNMYPAAVLIALYQYNNKIYFPLIKRIEDGMPHSGQIALPGGRLAKDESAQDAAIRESFEEIGLHLPVSIVKKLSPLSVAVSKYVIHPFVGLVEGVPAFTINQNEVEEIIIVSLEDLMNEKNIKRELWHIHNYPYVIPLFEFGNHKVWGATAMILSELRMMLLSAKLF